MPANTYSPYFAPGHLVPTLLGPDPSSVGSPLGHTVVPQAVPVAQQKIPRSDRLEVNWIRCFIFICFVTHTKYPYFFVFHLLFSLIESFSHFMQLLSILCIFLCSNYYRFEHLKKNLQFSNVLFHSIRWSFDKRIYLYTYLAINLSIY